MIGLSGSFVRVHAGARPLSVLLELDDGASVCLPAVPGFIGALLFDEDGELTQLSWEPADVSASDPSNASAAPTAALRDLRATVSAAVNRGVFRVQRDWFDELAAEMRGAAGPDPTLALYAAYAIHDYDMRGEIAALLKDKSEHLGFALFDLALLAAGDAVQRSRRDGALLPPFPLLTQGWPLLEVFRAGVDSELLDLRAYLRPSVWTCFEPLGTQRLLKRIKRKGGQP
jgi:hypothetical protein